jgi:hypothetical protein
MMHTSKPISKKRNAQRKRKAIDTGEKGDFLGNPLEKRDFIILFLACFQQFIFSRK